MDTYHVPDTILRTHILYLLEALGEINNAFILAGNSVKVVKGLAEHKEDFQNSDRPLLFSEIPSYQIKLLQKLFQLIFIY